jgi:hypothetical protein
VVNKLNAAGFGIGEFTYGGAGIDHAFEIDQFPIGGPNPAPGLSTFGVTNSFPNFPKQMLDDAYLVKSYFNGVSGCNEILSIPHSFGQQLQPIRVRFNRIQPLAFDTMRNPGTVNMNDTTLCFNLAVAGGNNARIAPPNSNNQGSSLAPYPNPIDASTGIVNLDYQSAADGPVEIRLIDMTGREVVVRNLNVVAGDQTLTVDFGAGLATGIYQLEIKNNGTTISSSIAVK